MSDGAARMKPGALSATFKNERSLHPSLSIDLSTVRSSNRGSCSAYVLVHLPEGLFFDPFTAPKTAEYEAFLLADRIELEKAVGWSVLYPELATPLFSPVPVKKERQWWEQPHGAEDVDGMDAQVQVDMGIQIEQALRRAIAQSSASADGPLTDETKSSVLQGVLEPGSSTGKAERTSVLLKLNTSTLPSRIALPLHSRYMAPKTSSTSDSRPSLFASAAELVSELLPSFLARSQTGSGASSRLTEVTIDTAPTFLTDCPIQSVSSVSLASLLPGSHSHLAQHFPEFLPSNTPVWSPLGSISLAPSLQVPTANFDTREAVQVTTAIAILLSMLYVLQSLRTNMSRLKASERF